MNTDTFELPPHSIHWKQGETYITKKHRIDVQNRVVYPSGHIVLTWLETPLNPQEKNYVQDFEDAQVQEFNVPTEMAQDKKMSFMDILKGWFKK